MAPLAVNLKVAPSISTAPRHISIRCRKISKYSYILQMSVSICRFSEMSFDCKMISRRLQSNCGKICVTVRNIALELHMDLNQCHKLAAQNQFDRMVPYHSPEIIRRADVVWIQTNCIGHKSYYNIIDLARRYDRKVRYFKYASASKCAEQIVEEENADE